MFKIFLSIALIIATAAPIFAVTNKEMEEAKAITAQCYLRYANDGSGYLDEFKASTMEELEAKLKTKEKENLVAFKSVKVPTDYASWDKARLVEFWSVTFFASPNLTEKGKGAKTRVKNRINEMTIADKPAAATEPETTSEEVVNASAPADAAETDLAAKEEQLVEKQEEILADQNAIAEDEQNRSQSKKSSGNTWLYVIILIILIGLVIWLVVFAANMMKKQAAPLAAAEGGNGANAKDLERLKERYESAKNTMEQYRAAFEDEQQETKRLRDEIKRLKEQLAVLQSASATRRAPREEESPRVETRRREEPTPRKSSNEFYLGRVNNRGLFVRADRQFSPGHSIYRLVTNDGLVGTFQVVNRPEVVDLVVEHPVEYLGGGCIAKDLEDTAGISEIITENAGTAVFEGGVWKVLRRSRIAYN